MASDVFDPVELLKQLPEQPGVYRMLGDDARVLYVGKAKSLKKRVASYFQRTQSSPRIALMVAQIRAVETTVTRSETEALLLENTLIKRLTPRYNIVFRDDKSYPYIRLSPHEFPRLEYFRGVPDRNGDYFGPFPSGGAVRNSLHLLQRTFRLRTCEDSVFANRTRPCLLFQIHRCSGPCVAGVSGEQYGQDVRLTRLLLSGKGNEVVGDLTKAMEASAAAMAFEEAARIRDQIRALRQIQERQFVMSARGEDADIVTVVRNQGLTCLNLAMVRAGEHLGDRPMFPQHADDAEAGEVIDRFLRQHYELHAPPGVILVNATVSDEALADIDALAKRKVLIRPPKRESEHAWVSMAEHNASLACLARAGSNRSQLGRLEALTAVLDLAETPVRIECFDISHTQGESPVAACVAYIKDGMRKSEYRRFNIRNAAAGDDYAAIREAVSRRYQPSDGTAGVRPDLVLIDGGLGQLREAEAALRDIGIVDLPLVGVSKGAERKAGAEKLVFPDGREPVQLGAEHPALLLIQEIRDEAHRFAVFGHRARREKTRRVSPLEGISGVGAAKRRNLINHLGGWQGVRDASVEQLAQVPGIGPALAEKVYRSLHS
jgi:excinuclease ABC subunit C